MATKSLHYRRVFGIYFNRAPTHTSNDKGERVFFYQAQMLKNDRTRVSLRGNAKFPVPGIKASGKLVLCNTETMKAYYQSC